MNVFKRYNYHKTGIRHGGPTGVKTRDSDALARFQNQHIRPQQSERFECDPWEEMILAHIENTQTDRLTVAGLLTNVIDKKAPARADSGRVKAILQRLGYVEKKSHGQRHYVKPE